MSLCSLLVSRVDITKDGINSLDFFSFHSWEQFINKDYVLHFKKDYLGVSDQNNLINFFASPFPVVFYWVDIYSLSNPNEITRIHFPKGEAQAEEFKNLAIYNILKKAKLLNTLTFSNNDEVNHLILKILR